MREKRLFITLITCMAFMATPFFTMAADSSAQSWKKIAEELLATYKGKIVSIEKLDNRSCWAVLATGTSNDEAVKLAEQIGDFIKKSSGDLGSPKVMIRVFINDEQVAIAVLSGEKYAGQLKSQSNLAPSTFKGSYKP